jgi:hypothetical protein
MARYPFTSSSFPSFLADEGDEGDGAEHVAPEGRFAGAGDQHQALLAAGAADGNDETAVHRQLILQ